MRTVAETGSTNADLLALATGGAEEGWWLRAERQTAGRGRQGRAWVSEPGNFYGSTLVRLRPADPPPPTLALVAGVAVEEAVSTHISPSPFRGFAASSLSRWEREGARSAQPSAKGEGGLNLKWPNDLLLDGAKLAGILLERAGDTVVIGCGVNLAHHPGLAERATTSLADHGTTVDPAVFAETLAESFARWLARWRGEGLAPIRQRWLERAHPAGTALTARLPDGTAVDGLFDGLDSQGALILRLADGARHVMHAGDVFLL
ncbi:biotin--[acetyl-CoA-carboxylase] ligase [Sphingomonas sp. DT-204]|uniref:biotin--[acetyl-CoA-carboxylase] ligase n=1 Tax=Sphingomonas sp. DT-204 TaxID=3396166 RepID=UPI003F1A0A72